MDTDTEGSSAGPWDDALTPAVREVVEEGAGEDEIDVESLTGPRRTLTPTIQVVWLLQAVVPSLVLGGIVAAAVAFLTARPPAIGAGVALAVFLVAALLSVLRYRSWAYEVRDDSLYLERGVITRVRTVAPYVRIQHVDASRGPIERGFGLATIVVYTAGSRGADVSIPGLSPDRAEDLQARLKRLAIAAEGEDAV
jgi:membrane protein YdbS with pleckstrin-like domain